MQLKQTSPILGEERIGQDIAISEMIAEATTGLYTAWRIHAMDFKGLCPCNELVECRNFEPDHCGTCQWWRNNHVNERNLNMLPDKLVKRSMRC